MRRLFVATAIALLWVVILVLSLFAQAGPGSSPVSPSFTIPPFEPPAGSVITVTTGLDNLSDNGDCTLREAIQAANTDAAVDACPAGNGDDLILVPAGSYVLSLEGRSEDDNATGDLDIRSSLVISGAGSAGTIIDANQTDRVLHILTGTVAIRGVTVQNGRAADGKDDPCEPNGYEGCPGETGGGIANEGYLKIFESRVVGNKSGNGGYAVIGGDGGGIWNTGIFIAYDITLANNETGTGGWDAKWQLPNGRGGGIANLGTMTITNSQIRANSADQNRGGGVYNAGDAWFFASAISQNWGGGFSIGGAGIFNAGNVVLVKCAIYDNQASRNARGGGLHNIGTASLINSTVSGNRSGYGYESYNNLTGADGGGIFNEGNLLLYNTTIAYNQTSTGLCFYGGCEIGGSGGGLANDGGAVTIHNSIIAQNSVADGGTGPDCTGVVTSQGPNFIGDPTGCTLGGTGDDILNQHAWLGPLADNGGPTPTHALLPYSPALDAGSCTDISGTPILTDQRGEPRPQGAGCDLGAFESVFSTIPLPINIHLPLVRNQPN